MRSVLSPRARFTVETMPLPHLRETVAAYRALDPSDILPEMRARIAEAEAELARREMVTDCVAYFVADERDGGGMWCPDCVPLRHEISDNALSIGDLTAGDQCDDCNTVLRGAV